MNIYRSNKWIIQILNLIAVFATITVNALANILPINGKYTGDISDSIPNLFVPSAITFAIWGVIYVLIIIFGIYQARDLFKKEKIEMNFLQKISIFFILASIGNIIWIFLWHYEQIILSLLSMILLLISLIAIYLKLNVGKSKVDIKEKLCVHVPISVYLGWITVATIANITAVLVKTGWDGFGISESTWTILILFVATIVALIGLFNRKDIAYNLVFIWAFIGIMIKRFASDPIFGVQTEIAYTAAICSIMLIAGIIFIVIKNNLINLNFIE